MTTQRVSVSGSENDKHMHSLGIVPINSEDMVCKDLRDSPIPQEVADLGSSAISPESPAGFLDGGPMGTAASQVGGEAECPTYPNCGPVGTTVSQDGGADECPTAVSQDPDPGECPTYPNCGPVGTILKNDAGVTATPIR
jgi:hypothetical protein